jgi:hypothetical protein
VRDGTLLILLKFHTLSLAVGTLEEGLDASGDGIVGGSAGRTLQWMHCPVIIVAMGHPPRAQDK